MRKKKINLALQGGGAHGAFTWGVLDRLLADDRIEISAITGTSAGALNGAAVKAGLATGGQDAARENLTWLWEEVMGVHDMRLNGWIAALTPDGLNQWLELSPGFQAFDAMTRMMSPYAYGPFYQNPLKKIVDRFKYDAVCAPTGPEFFICATNVRTGKVKVFEGDGINSDAILASACLPTLFQAVEIEGEHYWDGGYTGNPALFPVFQDRFPDDLVIVNINPLRREELPKSPQDIHNRINEISFNTSLLRELRAIEFVQRLLSEGRVPDGAMKKLNVHMIADDDMMGHLSVASKMVPQTKVILSLRDAGRDAAEAFLDQHFDKIGTESSVDLPAMFQ